jgi:hypothetical protein
MPKLIVRGEIRRGVAGCGAETPNEGVVYDDRIYHD